MRAPRITPRLVLLTACLLGFAASPANAIVGGRDAPQGAYPSVAEVRIASSFLCTGTLIAPGWVLTAGHCGSPTGQVIAIPVGFPPSFIDVRIGSVKPGAGERVTVSKVVVEPNYLATQGYDITLLQLAGASKQSPTPIANAGEAGLWSPGTLETIVGFGTTKEDGDTPDTLQQAQVPRIDDATCDKQVGGFDPATMLCGGFPQGGVDTCQGDSGGAMFGRTAAGARRVVGATSFGEGCARAGKPGVYARVAGDPLRSWIASQAPDAIAASAPVAAETPASGGAPATPAADSSAAKAAAAKKAAAKKAAAKKAAAKKRAAAKKKAAAKRRAAARKRAAASRS